ncbi:TonB-linked outer membrane protein, SusC/RagA family [bacterium A37T11]|nr:TonB-linked outer membrane protein, SusC/RagA family [bacterium A37T11]
MRYSLKTIVLLLMISPVYSLAQETTPRVNSNLHGKVLDSLSHEPLPGATVQIEGVTHSVKTDAEGNYNFVTGQKLPYTLIISYVGYKTKKVIAKVSPLNMLLTADANQLEDVVVVGYGTQTKKDLVGSVSKIEADEINRIPVASFDAQIQGKSTGIQVNNNSGVPGDGINVRVRGTTSILADNNPLYIVDGVFINNSSLQTVHTGGRTTSPIADINPTDIISMEVLKDASATSIYGARGANGVVIITTKRGNYNSAPKINLNVSAGQGKLSKYHFWELSDGPTNAEAVNQNYINTRLDKGIAYDVAYASRPFRPKIEGGRGNPAEQETYDRVGRVFRNAKLNDYDLSLQGGSESTKYFISGAYTSQESILKVADFERESLKLNLDQKINNHINIGVSNTFSRTGRSQVGAGNGSQGNILSSAALVQGTYNPIYNPDGTPSLSGNRDNVDVMIEDTDIKAVSTRYIANLFAEIEILKDLKFKTSWSLDYNLYDEKGYWSDRMLQGQNGGDAISSISQATTWINEQTLFYRKKIKGHTFGILFGNTLQGNTRKNTTAEGSGFPNNSYRSISDASIKSNSESWTGSNLASFFSRIDYNFQSRYFIEASIRADGSSRFGSKNKWGYFPSIGGSWRLKEESILKDVSAINELKLRASYGLTGNQNGIVDYASSGLWTGGAPYANSAGGGYSAGTAPYQLGNPYLQWEKTSQVNVGLDIGLFNKITIDANIYKKYTTDALLSAPLPSSSGHSSYVANAGELSNKGFEFGIDATIVKSNLFSWNTNFNISRNINKVEKLIVPITYYSRDWIRLEEGYPVNSFWVYNQLYVDPQTGNAVYEDVNSDGKITADDRKIIGTALPDYFGGFTNKLSYKGVDLSFLFTYQIGNKMLNLNRFLSMHGGTRADRSLYKEDENYWKKPGDITDIPRFTSQGNNWTLETVNRFIEDASFLRLKNLTVGYGLSKDLAKKFKVQDLRIYITGTNLWLYSKYKGPDPESNTDAEQMVQGIDFGTPPQPKTFQLGINVTL